MKLTKRDLLHLPIFQRVGRVKRSGIRYLCRLGKILRKRWYIVAFPLIPLCFFVVANWCFPLPTEKLQPSPSTVVLDRNGEWLRAFTAPDDMWRIVEPSLAAVSPQFQTALLTYEDRWFYQHWGINPVALLSAALSNLKARKIVRGGSTITMQVARLMEPKRRTLPNKLLEMFRALQLELTYTKSEILTFYINMLPYGGNIVGTAAASRLYFNKPQSALSVGEAALLAAIPNSPERLRPDRFPERARAARTKVLLRLKKRRKNLYTADGGSATGAHSDKAIYAPFQSTTSQPPPCPKIPASAYHTHHSGCPVSGHDQTYLTGTPTSVAKAGGLHRGCYRYGYQNP